MTPEAFSLRQAVVLASALVYWAGVAVQVRRVRKRIGRAPNVRPRSRKERWLWVGWVVVVGVWLGLPLLVRREGGGTLLALWPAGLHPLALVAGLTAIAAGYAATLWCYALMGDTWRMGVDQREKTTLVTRGPYAVIRHPIYLFQIVMLAGVVLLLPTLLGLAALLLHIVCVWIKAADEETYLLGVQGEPYRAYLARTGRLLPRLSRPA